MRNFSRQKRIGVAQALMTFLLLIILIGAMYIPLNYVVQSYQQLQQQMWNNNVFDPDTLVFINSYWTWLPIIVLVTGIAFVYLASQKRTMYD